MPVLPLPSSMKFRHDFSLCNALAEEAERTPSEGVLTGSSPSNPKKQAEEVEAKEEEEYGRKRDFSCAYSDEDTSYPHKLVKIELDAAEALAEFSRLAREADSCLQWSGRRRRSTRVNVNTTNAYIGSWRWDYLGRVRAHVKAHVNVSDRLKLSSGIVHTPGPKNVKSQRKSLCPSLGREDNETIIDTQESHLYLDSRAESPSSPLPPLHLPCTRLLVTDGDPEAKSAFQQVIAPLAPIMQCNSLFQPKSKIEEYHSKILAGRPQKMAARCISKSSKPNTLSVWPPVKTETLCEVDMETKVMQNQSNGVTDRGVNCLVSLASNVAEVTQEVGFRVINKPKTVLTESEKDARRLRRIHANRESARQTIRRKQILCEELMMKAANLAAENESMKQKREQLMQDLYSLKNQNHQLKQQLGENTSENSELGARIELQPFNSPALKVPTSMQCTGDSIEATCMERCIDGEAALPNQDLKDDGSQIASSEDAQDKDVCELPNQVRDSSAHISSTECYMVPPLYSYPYTCGSIAIKGSFPTHMYMGQKSYIAVLAAAEARKRRKEITLSKFSRARVYRRQMK